MYGEQSTGDGSKSPAVACGVSEILAQGHDRHQAHDADQNEDRLHRARGNVPEGDAFVDPLHDGENDHGGGVPAMANRISSRAPTATTMSSPLPTT